MEHQVKHKVNKEALEKALIKTNDSNAKKVIEEKLKLIDKEIKK